MINNRRRFLAVAAAAALAPSVRATPITRVRFHALGTDAQITLAGEQSKAETALQACRTEVAAIEHSFSLYNPDSLLSQLNRYGSVATTQRFTTLVQHAHSMAEATDGAFDPTMQPLWRALATGENTEVARRLIGWQELEISKGNVHFTRPNMAASFNGIAQGFAADRVSAILIRHGFNNTLVNLGEFAVQGIKPAQANREPSTTRTPEQTPTRTTTRTTTQTPTRTTTHTPWRLGIHNPLTQRIVAHIEPVGAIATSEPHGTLVAGHPHIIDPLRRSGERWVSVTVEAGEAWRADALSTAIAASPTQNAVDLLHTGGATRAWLIAASGNLHQWQV